MKTPKGAAFLKQYPEGGFILTMPDGSEYEADTKQDAYAFAHAEGYLVINMGKGAR